MKAVILAGGRGERLRPITDTRPKPLVPVLARPVMDYCLSLLAHHGVTEAFVTTHYLAEQIRHRYGDRAFGMKMCYFLESSPLGTAGGVKRLEENFLGEELFVVMSGDALCDFDLTRAMNFHKEKKADVTVVLSSVKTPLEYGVVLSDTFEKIFAFSEKPDWSETFSDQVNTGVYIISPAVLKKIPEDQPFDFSQDLFPRLLKEGYALYGYKDDGYWCDIGKIPALYRCNRDLLSGKVKTYLPEHGRTLSATDGNGNYFVSHGARVSRGAHIGDGTVISSGAEIADGARVSGSVLLENVKLESDAVSRDALLCENATLREGATVLPGTVLGAGSTVMPRAVTDRKRYAPRSVVVPGNVFGDDSLLFTENGISSADGVGLDEEDVKALGNAFARCFSSKVAVLWDGKGEKSAYFASLFAGGVVLGGRDALLLGEGCFEMASFAATLYATPAVFIGSREDRAQLFGFGADGFPLLRRDTLRLSRLCREEQRASAGRLISRTDLRERYVSALCSEMGEAFEKRIGFSGTSSAFLKEAAIRAGWLAYNGSREKGLSMEVFDHGVKLYLDGEKIADTEKIRLYLAEKELEAGKREFFLPDTLPTLFREHIEARGGRVHLFSLHHTTRSEAGERSAAKRERWLYDHYFLVARLLHELREKSTAQCRSEFRATPDIYITKLCYLPKEENKARLLGALPRESEEKGTRVRIRPGYYGIRIISEALSVEAALENAFECRGKINEIEEKIGGRK